MDPAIIYMALPTHILYKSWYRFARQLINTTKKNQDITHEHCMSIAWALQWQCSFRAGNNEHSEYFYV